MAEETLKPGDQVGGFMITSGPVAYQGKAGCTSPMCSRLGDICVGYHCAICDKPSGIMGHKECRDALEREEAEAHDGC